MAAKWCDPEPASMPDFASGIDLVDLPGRHPVCLHNLTKNVGGNGDAKLDHAVFKIRSVRPSACPTDRRCETLVVRCRVELPINSFPGPDLPPEGTPGDKDDNGKTDPCESDVSSRLLNGTLVVPDMVLIFKRADRARPVASSSWRLRGFHAGDFAWSCLDSTTRKKNGLTVTGRMMGTNSTGLFTTLRCRRIWTRWRMRSPAIRVARAPSISWIAAARPATPHSCTAACTAS